MLNESKLRNWMFLFFVFVYLAFTSWDGAQAADNYLEPDVAFVIEVKPISNNQIQLKWKIAKGYSLYQERMKLFLDEKDVSQKISFPTSIKKFDTNFNKQVNVYKNLVTIAFQSDAMTQQSVIRVQYQGCSDDGLCCSPIEKKYQLSGNTFLELKDSNEETITPLNQVTVIASASAPASSTISDGLATAALPVASAIQNNKVDAKDEVSMAQNMLQSGNLFTIAISFLGFGLLLAFTPCVLPMVPILSGIILGSEQNQKMGTVQRPKGFALALAYSLGMVTVYTLLGIAAGLLGSGLAIVMQKPLVIGFFALMIFLMSLSMFDVYQLQMPSFIQDRLNASSMKIKGGKLISVYFMGFLSALMVGPCVAGPLAGALIYISQSRDVLLGGLALFSMGLGMSVPLLLTGASAGALLPKAGAWMNGVKVFFGLMLMATSIWMLQSIIHQQLWLLVWGVWLIIAAVFLQLFDSMPSNPSSIYRFKKVLAIVLFVAGCIEIVGASLGASRLFLPLQPLVQSSSTNVNSVSAITTSAELKFKRIKNLAQLNQELKASSKIVMLDFYADWCTSCIEMEKFTFVDPTVIKQLSNVVLLQIDVTDNSPEAQLLMKEFHLFGPPAIVFFNAQDQEIQNSRVIGYLKADKFSQHLSEKIVLPENLN